MWLQKYEKIKKSKKLVFKNSKNENLNPAKTHKKSKNPTV